MAKPFRKRVYLVRAKNKAEAISKARTKDKPRDYRGRKAEQLFKGVWRVTFI